MRLELKGSRVQAGVVRTVATVIFIDLIRDRVHELCALLLAAQRVQAVSCVQTHACIIIKQNILIILIVAKNNSISGHVIPSSAALTRVVSTRGVLE